MILSLATNLDQTTNNQDNDFEKVDKSARQNQVIENINDHQVIRAVSSAVMTFENCMHDAILAPTDNVVIPRVEMAVKLITDSTGHGTKSEVQKPDRRDFTGNIRTTPLMAASSRLVLDNELDRNDGMMRLVMMKISRTVTSRY